MKKSMKWLVGFLFCFNLMSATAQNENAVERQWLLNFDSAEGKVLSEYYYPDAAVGEKSPIMVQPGDLIPDPKARPQYADWTTGGIRIINKSGKLRFVTLPDGRKVLDLHGTRDAADGLVFEHFRRGCPSRILEAVISISSVPKDYLSRLISSNDWRMRPPGQIVALQVDQAGRPTVELRSPHAYEFYPVAEELDSMHRFVRDQNALLADGQFHHVAVVYDHSKQTIFLYTDGKMVRGTPMSGTDHEFAIYRSVGLSGDVVTGRPVEGFSGQIDAVAETVFEGPFKPEYFQLTQGKGPEPPALEYATIALTIPSQAFDLPRLPNLRISVFEPRSWNEETYHHGPLIAFFKGKCIVAWHAAARSETDAPEGLVSSSEDLKTWSVPGRIPAVPRILFEQNGNLYLWGCSGEVFVSSDGEEWKKLPGSQHPFAADISSVAYSSNLAAHEPLVDPDTRGAVTPENYLSSEAMERGPGHPFIKLADGRWMAPVSLGSTTSQETLSQKKVCAPITTNPNLSSNWSGGLIDVSEAPIVGNAAGWEGPDGVLHIVSRCGPHVWHSSSSDHGATWTPLLPQPEFTDSPSYKVFGKLPGGENYYLGNPYPGSRAQLVFATSGDGWKFDNSYLIRWESVTPRFPSPCKNFSPGYEGVSSVIHEGRLYAVYSVCRERIEIACIDLPQPRSQRDPERLQFTSLVKPHPGTGIVPDLKQTIQNDAGRSEGVHCEWLLNFDGDTSEMRQTYTPNPSVGEIPPEGERIEIINRSGALAFTRKDGRGVVYLEGKEGQGDGFLFEHRLDGYPSRIFEAIVQPTTRQASEARLFGLNDWQYRPPGQIRFFGIGSFNLGDLGSFDFPFVRIEPLMGPFRAASGPGHYYLRGVDPFSPSNRFQHVAMVVESDREALYLYVDGHLSKSLYLNVKQNEFPIFRAIGLSNGARQGEAVSGFAGYIDSVAESTFSGSFKTTYFQLIHPDDETPEPPAFDRKVKLNLPYQLDAYPQDEGTHLAYLKAVKSRLSKIPSETHTVHYPNSFKELCYHHNAITTWFKDRLYVSWHAGERAEFARYYGGFVTSSEDMEHWTPLHWVPSTPRTMHASEDGLYLWQFDNYSVTRDGIHWKTFERTPENNQLFDYVSNHHHVQLSDGRLMTVDTGRPRLSREEMIKGYSAVVNFTSDRTGMSGWKSGRVDVSPCDDVGEPSGYEGPDGVLHYIARCGFHIFHSASYDRGETWTPLLPQPDFPDNAANKEFGSFPDGSVWYVGNPIFGDRRLLVLGISRDGWNFDQVYTVRDEEAVPNYPAPFKAERPGYEYPTACYHDGRLYIGYSWFREGIEISVVDVAGLGLTRRGGDQQIE